MRVLRRSCKKRAEILLCCTVGAVGDRPDSQKRNAVGQRHEPHARGFHVHRIAAEFLAELSSRSNIGNELIAGEHSPHVAPSVGRLECGGESNKRRIAPDHAHPGVWDLPAGGPKDADVHVVMDALTRDYRVADLVRIVERTSDANADDPTRSVAVDQMLTYHRRQCLADSGSGNHDRCAGQRSAVERHLVPLFAGPEGVRLFGGRRFERVDDTRDFSFEGTEDNRHRGTSVPAGTVPTDISLCRLIRNSIRTIMRNLETARRRAAVINALRSFFTSRGYLEVDTPSLAPAVLPEAHIEPFATRTVHPFAPSLELYLLPSPELWMKRLLAAGYGNIFQIGKCYRNAEQTGAHHSHEFTMLEWYTVDAGPTGADERGYWGRRSIDCRVRAGSRPADDQHAADLTDDLLEELSSVAPSPHCRPPALRASMGELCETHAGLRESDFADPDRIQAAARRLGMEVSRGEPADDTFNRIFLTHVEPEIPKDRPVMITDYPAIVPAFAETAPDRPVRRRWELYLGGTEVANCFAELRDRHELQQLFDGEIEQRQDAMVPAPADTDFVDAFAGAPPCSGVAMGVDRLLMALLGVESIGGVIFFPDFGMVR